MPESVCALPHFQAIAPLGHVISRIIALSDQGEPGLNAVPHCRVYYKY